MSRPPPIVGYVKRYRIIASGAILAGLGLLGAGCGGVQGSHSVSPASLFLPGLIQHEVKEPRPEGNGPMPVEPAAVVASGAKPVAS